MSDLQVCLSEIFHVNATVELPCFTDILPSLSLYFLHGKKFAVHKSPQIDEEKASNYA